MSSTSPPARRSQIDSQFRLGNSYIRYIVIYLTLYNKIYLKHDFLLSLYDTGNNFSKNIKQKAPEMFIQIDRLNGRWSVTTHTPQKKKNNNNPISGIFQKGLPAPLILLCLYYMAHKWNDKKKITFDRNFIDILICVVDKILLLVIETNSFYYLNKEFFENIKRSCLLHTVIEFVSLLYSSQDSSDIPSTLCVAPACEEKLCALLYLSIYRWKRNKNFFAFLYPR